MRRVRDSQGVEGYRCVKRDVISIGKVKECIECHPRVRKIRENRIPPLVFH